MKNDGICDRNFNLDNRKPDTAGTAVQKNHAETRRSDQARALLEEVAEATMAPATQSMLAVPDENMIDTTRKAKGTQDRVVMVWKSRIM